MDEHILATSGRLDETITFGRVDPLHSTLSHSQVSAGLKQSSVPGKPACPTAHARYAVSGRLDRSNTQAAILGEILRSIGRILPQFIASAAWFESEAVSRVP